ncbi:hypothetical protein K458DRAFT_138478 [Lentithecium fluviatile CBS 122367]|uniref:Uncharacterized protein n=1 Tax=Lentithecium fluviatile CBS 122367 TaxID=1168545 RepID=A0A6G1IJJ2_9PLEO|nr:hypothetical protein K458DRAFT_138478 [Lentithecium fluviatile CBS 122367]
MPILLHLHTHNRIKPFDHQYRFPTPTPASLHSPPPTTKPIHSSTHIPHIPAQSISQTNFPNPIPATLRYDLT